MSAQAQIHEAGPKKNELLKVLSETDYATPALNQQQSWVTELQRQIRDSNVRLKQLHDKRENYLKEHGKYRDSTVRRFMYKATGNREKFTEKASKGEQEYFGVLQEAQLENNRNAALNAQHVEAAAHRDDLQSVVTVHDNAQQELDAMYHRIFSGETAEFPEEDELEQRCNSMVMAYRECRGKWEAETAAVQALGSAEAYMRESLRCVSSALQYSRWDMFGGGRMADAMERNELAKCDRAAMQARLQVSKARKASPFVQDLPGVNINHGHIFADVFFDNIITDMRFHREIERAAGELQRCALALRDEIHRAKDRRAVLETGLRHRETELETTRRELQKMRQDIFERVLSERRGVQA